jgi:tetratricopeptide (TPR) repeat protein
MADKKRPRRNIFDEIANWLSPESVDGEGRQGRARLAQVFAVLGTAFAVIQLLFSALDLANRAVSSLLRWLPYLVPALFIAGAAAAIYLLVTTEARVQQRRAAALLGVILVAGAGWGGWTYYQAKRPPKAVIVLVADFEGQQATKGVDWGRRIYERVKEQVDQLNLGARVEVERVFEAFGSSELAAELGSARKATVVLWGWYDDIGVSPHFELLRSVKRFESGLAAPPQDLTDFEVYIQSGPQEMAYVVSVVLGLVHYADGNFRAAEDLFTTALASAPSESSLLGLEISHFYRANARFLGYDRPVRPMEALVADLEESVSLRPDFWQAHWNLALAYTDHCTPTLTLDAALVEAERVLQLQPTNPDALWLLGQIHAEREEWGPAEALHRQALLLDPTLADAQEALAKALEELGRTDEARQAYGKALELRRAAETASSGRGEGSGADPAELEDRLGYAYLNAGQYDLAITAFDEALRLRPDDALFHRHLGNAYYWQGKTDPSAPSGALQEAIAEYEQAHELDATDGLLLTVLGGAYEEAGRPEDALRSYEAAVAVSPCDGEALFLLASQYDSLGLREDAQATFQRLVELDPGHAVGWQWLATTAFLDEDYPTAAEAYRAGGEADPLSADLQYGLGVTLHRVGDFEGSEAAYRRANTLAPQDPATLTGWGDALAKMGETDAAIAVYEEASELAPEYLTWLSLGFLYEMSQRWQDAVSVYGRAAEARPDDALAYAARGTVLQRLGRHEEAVEDLVQAVQIDQTNGFYWEALALSYSALERADDAFQAATEALKGNPSSAAAYLVRGGVHESRGENERAHSDYQQVLELSGESDPLRQLAQEALQRLQQ